MTDHGPCPKLIAYVISFARENQEKSAGSSSRISGSPFAGRKRLETEIFSYISNIEPGQGQGSVYLDGDQDAAVEAGTVGVKPLQPVDGRKAVFGIVEGQKLPVHVAPGRACALLREPVGGWLGIGHAGRHVRLCGHIGERVGGPDGKDVLLRDLKDRDAGGCLEEAAADDGVLHRQNAPAKKVVVPETALQGCRRRRVSAFRLCSASRVLLGSLPGSWDSLECLSWLRPLSHGLRPAAARLHNNLMALTRE